MSSGTSQPSAPSSAPSVSGLAREARATSYERADAVVVVVYAKGSRAEQNTALLLDARTLELRVTMPDDSVFTSTLRLCAPVALPEPNDAGQRPVPLITNAYKVAIMLPKAAPSEQVDDAVDSAADLALTPASSSSSSSSASSSSGAAGPPAYASRKGKNWDEISAELGAEEDAASAGGDPMTKLLRQIYANADPDKKRAMMKSFQESNGTVLTTNWEQARDEDYKKTFKPPQGQEFRRFEH